MDIVYYRVWLLSILIIIIATATFSGCGADSEKIYAKNGKEYGKLQGSFRHRWWNYYERGLSYADGEFYQEALADFKKAILQREKDQRMARTYGMHFIDYFPHREAGITCYQMGDPERAMTELELSLSQFPSAKAHFYLDRVRKALIELKGKDIPPPILTIDFKTDEVWTRQDSLLISGTASDKHYVAEITINGIPLFLEASKKIIAFEKILPFFQGRHLIEVKAKNLLGKTTKRQIVVNVDREGPMITLEGIDIDRDRAGRTIVTISGSIYDKAGPSKLKINGRSISIRGETEFFFIESLEVKGDDFELVSMDRLGNQTSARIFLKSNLNEIESKQGKAPHNNLFFKSGVQNPGSKSCFPGHMPVLLASADSDARGLFMAGIFGPRDIHPPCISLEGWSDKQTVFMERVYIEGQVRDESNIVSLRVNQNPILRREGRCIIFGHLVDLQVGENDIVIEARDEAGNTVARKIRIIRKTPKVFLLNERLCLTAYPFGVYTLGINPFRQKSNIPGDSLYFHDKLISALVDQNRFRVVERDKLAVILQEHKLSLTKLIDKNTALKIGNLIQAKSIIIGNIFESRTGIEIVARLIDTETSEILATRDVYAELKDYPALRSMAKVMAVKFHRDFPLSDGLIIQQQGKYIVTDLGKDKLRAQRRLIIYREKPIKHPISEKMLGMDNVIKGRARVTRVMAETSKAEISTGDFDFIECSDKVIPE